MLGARFQEEASQGPRVRMSLQVPTERVGFSDCQLPLTKVLAYFSAKFQFLPLCVQAAFLAVTLVLEMIATHMCSQRILAHKSNFVPFLALASRV